MAGSYGHIVDDDGKYIGIDFIENLGDADEALEECYGMIWYLANGDLEVVERAQENYRRGIAMSPGVT